MKLIKLLYLADREALKRWGRPVTTDRFVSMTHGPVLSQVLDRINSGSAPGEPSPWSELISAPDGYDVRLAAPTVAPADDELSEAETELLAEVFEGYGHRNRWELVELVHALPEWKDPEGSSIPFEYGDVLRAMGSPETEVEAVERNLEAVAFADRYAS